MKKPTITISLTKEQRASLQSAARARGKSVSAFVRAILIQQAIIPDQPIARGGYRKRRTNITK